MPMLSWEYWDGKGWNLLEVDISKDYHCYNDNDNDNDNINKICKVNFKCPIDIVSTKVNGFENYWIRVRIASGDYGKIQMNVTNTNGPQTIELRYS